METPAEYNWDAHWRARTAAEPSRAQREAAALVLRQRPAEVERVADLGSGAGIVAILIAQQLPGVSVVGVDSSAESCSQAAALAVANAVTNASFVSARAEELPFDDATLDLVYSDQLLQYTDERKVIGEVARVLRPGGRAVLIVPNAANIVFAATARIAGDRHGSRRVYTRRRLRALVHAAALTVVGWDGYLPAYPVQRLGYFYAPWVAPLGTAAERVADRIDSISGRGLSHRFGFAVAVVAERRHQ